MRLKYYLRGIAAGVVVSTCILTISHNVEMRSMKSSAMTDDEIVEAAKELGMVFEEDVVKLPGNNVATTDGDSQKVESNNEVVTNGNSPTKIDKPDVSPQVENTEPVKEETKGGTNSTSDEKAARETEAQIKESANEILDNANQDLKEVFEVQISITSGMTSDKVAKQLKEKGVIEDAADFDSFMMKNGYDNKIWIGDHTIQSDDTYEEIASKLIGK